MQYREFKFQNRNMCLETGLAPYNQTQKPERHSLCSPKSDVSWLSRGPDSSGEVWIGCKRLILKLSKVLSVQEVKGFYMPPNQRLIPI